MVYMYHSFLIHLFIVSSFKKRNQNTLCRQRVLQDHLRTGAEISKEQAKLPLERLDPATCRASE